MKIKDMFNQGRKVFSFELFPPKRDGDLEALFKTVEDLKRFNPSYISITYGAGGSTRDMTYEIALRLKAAGVIPLVHFTCMGHSRGEIRGLLDKLRDAGIENILALRGDPPKGQAQFVPAPDGFRYASELISFIRGEGYGFGIGMAGYPEGHPEAVSFEEDLANLKRKAQAGGEFVVTQLYFDNRDYFNYVDRIRGMGVQAPVQPGIWLITDYAQIKRFCVMAGAKFPAKLERLLAPIQEDKEAVTRAGIEYATEQCAELLEKGAPGIHFYVMNRSRSVGAVYENLRRKGLAP